MIIHENITGSPESISLSDHFISATAPIKSSESLELHSKVFYFFTHRFDGAGRWYPVLHLDFIVLHLPLTR